MAAQVNACSLTEASVLEQLEHLAMRLPHLKKLPCLPLVKSVVAAVYIPR